MRRSQVVFFLIIGAAVALAVVGTLIGAILSAVDSAEEALTSTDSPVQEAPAGSVNLIIQSSNTKELWLDMMVEQFNEADNRIESGERIFAQVIHTGSPMEPELRPVMWSPSNNLWVAQLNQDEMDLNQRQIISEGVCPDTINMPIGIAMWRPMAEALGWPQEDISWQDIIDLATNPDGWASLGHPEWGQFRYGHGHPGWSNSGRLSIVAQVHAATGKTSELEFDDVWADSTLEDLTAIQQSIAHYGRRDTFLLDRMVVRGPSYLHAVTNYEGNVIRWNAERGDEMLFPFAMIYPVDGTFWEGHPICVLDNAEWVSDQQIEAGRRFQEFVTAREQQEQLVSTGLRPAMEGISLDGPDSVLRLENGVIPSITRESMPLIPYPSPDTMNNVIDMWYQVKKPSTVVLVLDTSGSMIEDNRLGAASQGASQFVTEMQPGDEIIVLTFSDTVTQLEPSGTIREVQEELPDKILGLFPDGGTALYDATLQALSLVNDLQAEDEAAGERRLYGIVLMTDGEDTAGTATEAQMFSQLPDGTEADQVHIYTIAYGEGTNEDLLSRIANRTNGQFYRGAVQDIQDIYFQISSEF